MKMHKLENPKKTFFFERHDGSTIAVGEQEAWNIYSGKTQVVGSRMPRPKLIGVSDGRKMWQAVVDAHAMYVTDQEGAMSRVKEGEKEELEAARGNIEIPRNFDKVGIDGRPESYEQRI